MFLYRRLNIKLDQSYPRGVTGVAECRICNHCIFLVDARSGNGIERSEKLIKKMTPWIIGGGALAVFLLVFFVPRPMDLTSHAPMVPHEPDRTTAAS
jgi:hypothetical protein